MFGTNFQDTPPANSSVKASSSSETPEEDCELVRLLATLRSLCTSDNHYLVLRAGDTKVPAHSALLKARSPFMARQLEFDDHRHNQAGLDGGPGLICHGELPLHWGGRRLSLLLCGPAGGRVSAGAALLHSSLSSLPPPAGGRGQYPSS